MKATWLLPVTLSLLACGGGTDGPRGGVGSLDHAGAGGVPTDAGGANSIPTAGAVAETGGTRSAGGMTSGGGIAGAGGAQAGASGGGGGAIDTGPQARPDQRTVVYLPQWRGALSSWAAKMDFSRVTYLNVCFAEVAANGDVSYKDDGLDGFVEAAHTHGVKVCLAIGGATVIDTGGVFATVLQDDLRDGFVEKLGKYAADHQLDCIDVDLEGNGVNQYYEAFVTSLAARLHADKKEMTSAVSSWFGEKITSKAIQAFDFINIMAYDLHNPGGSTEPVQSSSIPEATAEVDYWVNRGLAKDRAVFGVPFYGYRWAGNRGEALTYAEVLAQNPAASTQDQLQIGGHTVFLNSRATIGEKAKLAKTYGGIMVWELGQDAPGDASLLKAIADATQ